MNGDFLSPLEVREKRDDSGAVLDADFKFFSTSLDRLIVVPAGFETDYASVPRLPFAYSLFGGRAKWAAVIHDYLYRRGHQLAPPVTRSQADEVFLEAMEVSEVSGWRRYSMWAGVRLFGWTAFDNGKKETKDEEADEPLDRSPG